MRFTLSFTSVCPLIKLCSIVDISLQIFRRNALLAAIMYNLFYTLGLHYWFFLFLISFPRFGLEEYTTTTHITTQETTTLFTLYGIRRACACFWKILIVFIVLSGIDLEIYFWMKWCLVKIKSCKASDGYSKPSDERDFSIATISDVESPSDCISQSSSGTFCKFS